MDEKDLNEKQNEIEEIGEETVENSAEETVESEEAAEAVAEEAAEEAPSEKATEFEDNDNWTFDAEAQTLNIDDMLVADNPDTDASKVIEDIDEDNRKEKEEKKKEKEEKQKSNEIVIKKDTFVFVPGIILIIAAVAVLAFFGYRYYNVPSDKEGRLMNPGSVVMTVDGVDVSAGMYNYYYSSIVSYFESYASYGQVDLDTSQSYDVQTTTDENGNTMTWSEYFQKQTIQQIEYITVYYGKALDEGIKLTSKQEKVIEEQMSGLLDSAIQQAGKSDDESLTDKGKSQILDDYIKAQFGKYVSEQTLRAMLEQYYLAVNYRGSYATKALDDSYLDTYRTEHEKEYYNINIAIIGFQFDTADEVAVDEAKAKAEDYVSRMTDEQSVLDLVPEAYEEEIASSAASLMSSNSELTEEEANEEALQQYLDSTVDEISYSDAVNYFDTDTTNWLFDKDSEQQANYYIDQTQGFVYVMLKTSEPHLDETPTYAIRHILISPDQLEEESEETEEETETTTETTTADATQEAIAEETTTEAQEEEIVEAAIDEAETADDAAAGDVTATEDEGFTEEEMQKAYLYAENILTQFNEQNGTETDFAYLAEEYSSDDGSTTMSGQNDVYGGLYEMTEETNFVESFKNWVLDESRENGQTEIVESTYGYHIMYFIKSAPAYEIQLEDAAVTAKIDEMIDNAEVKVHQNRLNNTVKGYTEYKNELASNSTAAASNAQQSAQ